MFLGFSNTRDLIAYAILNGLQEAHVYTLNYAQCKPIADAVSTRRTSGR